MNYDIISGELPAGQRLHAGRARRIEDYVAGRRRQSVPGQGAARTARLRAISVALHGNEAKDVLTLSVL